MRKSNEEDYCKGCGTFELREMIGGLVEKLVGEKPMVVVRTPKVLPKKVQEPIIKETKVDRTDGLFVGVGTDGTILTSSDGNSWTQRTSPTSKYLMGVTYGNGLFVGVGNDGTILTSPDGNSWTQRTSPTSKYLMGVTYGNGLFVGVGNDGTILTSPDGNSWTQMEYQRTSGKSNNLYGVTHSQ